MIKKIKNKKGLTQKTIIGMIIAIAIIIILIYFVVRTIRKEDLKKQVCHDSVIVRATAIEAGLAYAPDLKCESENICVTTGKKGDKCEDDFTETEKKDLQVFKVETEDDAREVIAEALRNCWWMLGEGKIKNFERPTFLKAYAKHCITCSKIVFSEGIKKKYGTIDDIISYLQEKEIPPGDLTYWQFLTGSRAGEKVNLPQDAKASANSLLEIDLEDNRQYIITFVEFSKSDLLKEAFGLAGTVAGVALTFKFHLGFVAGGGAILGGRYIGSHWGDKLDNVIHPGEESYHLLSFLPKDLKNLKALDCKWESTPVG